MANTVEIVVKGTDQSGRALRSAADETKRVGEHAKGASAGLKLMGVAAAGLAAGGLVKFLKDSVAEARESQKVNAQTAAVLKSTGGAAHITADEIGRLATKISNKTGIDDEQIQSNENMLLTFTNVRNEVGKGNDIFSQATQTVMDMSVALGQDGKNSAIQLGKALNDPIKGITALSRVGVTFTEDQKKQIKTLMEHNDILGAQKIILGELNKEFGGSAAAQATAGEKMKAVWKNFEEDIGTKLLPLLDKMETWFATKVVPVLEDDVIPAVMNVAKWITGTLVPALRDELGPAVKTAAEWVKNTLVPALKSFGSWIADHKQEVSTFAESLAAVIVAAKGYQVINGMALAVRGLTLAMADNPIGAIVIGLIAIATWFVITYNKSREFRDNVQDAFSDFKIWCTEAGMAFEQNFVQYIIAGFKFIIDGLVKAFGWVPIIGPKLKDAQRAVHSWADDVRDHISNLKADIKTEQVKMKVRDMQRTIDNIRQNRVPGLNANTFAGRMEIARLQYMIDHMRGRTIEITTIYTQINKIFTVQDAASNRGPGGVTSRTGGIWRAAAGGIRSGYGLVGEEGPELVKLPRGSMVYPAGQTRGMLSRMGGSGGGGRVVLEINSGGSKLDDLLVELLRKAIRTRGGDVQLVLGR